MKNTAKFVAESAVSIPTLSIISLWHTLLFPYWLTKSTLRCLWWGVFRIYQALIGVAGACTWLVTARVPSPRFAVAAARQDYVGSLAVFSEGKKENFDVMPWEVPQGSDTIKIMGGYSNPPLNQLAPDKIESYWDHLLDSEKQYAEKSGKDASLAAAQVLKGSLKAYFGECRAAVVIEMQKARGFVNSLIRMIKEKGVGVETAMLRCTVPSEPDTCALLGDIVKSSTISLEELSCYNDRLEQERKAYVSKMQAFQARAKVRYRAVNNAYHKHVLDSAVATNEWAHMQRAAILEGRQVTPASSSLLIKQKGRMVTPSSRGSAKSEELQPLRVERKLFVEIPDDGPEERVGISCNSPKNYQGVAGYR